MNNQNGRVNIMGPNLTTKFSMMDKIPINTNTNYQNVLTGNFERSRLSDSFFSQQNIRNYLIPEFVQVCWFLNFLNVVNT